MQNDAAAIADLQKARAIAKRRQPDDKTLVALSFSLAEAHSTPGSSAKRQRRPKTLRGSTRQFPTSSSKMSSLR